MTEEYQGWQFIGGERRATPPAVLASFNASDGSNSGVMFFVASAAEVSAAAEAAAAAFPYYSQLSSTRRADFLDTLADEIDALGDDFLQIARRETALSPQRLTAERTRTSNQLRLFAGLLRRGESEKVRIDTARPQQFPPRPDLRQYQLGLGPVAVFPAGNFPLAFSVAGGDSAAALAAGCSLVVKAHPGHMRTAERMATAMARACQRHQLPGGVFNLVFGDEQTGARLVSHPAIQAVAFTGSLAAGQALLKLVQQRAQPVPLYAEMSAINPLILLPQALAQHHARLAEQCLASFTLSGGQLCTKPGIIFLQQGHAASAFIHRLTELTRSVAAQTLLSPRILRHYQQGIARWHQHPDLTLLAGGETQPHQAEVRLYQASAQLLAKDPAMLVQEIFGPVAVVVPVADSDELMFCLQQLPGQLTATLHAAEQDTEQAQQLMTMLSDKAGRVGLTAFLPALQ